MQHWDAKALTAIDKAIADTANGHPRLVVIHGAPGSGRTAFLAMATERALTAENFIHRTTSGIVKGDVPLRGLQDLGVTIGPDPSGEAPTALMTDRSLREAIDDDLDSSPLLFTIDDLQWIDPETVDALARVIDNAVAERLLLIVTVGNFEPFQHVAWQQMVASSPLVVPIELAPLTLDAAIAIAAEARPDVRNAVVRRLWEHTQGSPLFFTAILRRTELADLERMEQLPAPDDWAWAVEVRLAGLGDDAIKLARAAAVIGVGWMPLAEVAYVAESAHPTAALDVLDREFILETRMSKLGAEVRIVHAVIQAAIYQYITVAERVRLHSRAAEVALDEPNELRHLYAAATTYNEDLAQRFEDAAETQRDERSHRLAATYLDWASRISKDGLLRSRRSMDSYFEWILAGSEDFVRGRLDDIHRGRDRAGAALIQGALYVVDNELLDAVRVLRPVSNSGDNSVRAYRIETLLAWASMGIGASTAEILQVLQRGESMDRRDDTLAGMATFTTALVAGRGDQAESIREHMERLPTRPAAVPMDDTYWLAWQGMGLGFDGRLSDAIPPLRESSERMATGFIDVGDGLTGAFLGWCYLLTGAPELAAPHFRAAEALMRPRPHPMTAAIIAGGYVHRGERERAAELFSQVREGLREMPWPEGVTSLLGSEAGYMHAYGTEHQQAALLGSYLSDFGSIVDASELAGPLAMPWMALAYLWSGDLNTAERFAAELESRADLPWTASSAWWLRGLVAERRGNERQAFEHLIRATELASDSIPILTAHVASDLARLATAIGDSTLAEESAARAALIYARVGARGYLPAITSEHLLDDAPEAPFTRADPETTDTPWTATGVFAPLSEREREVAALVIRGMSYAQIARELFITRSTVGFHLSRIYARTGTHTRHELSELAGRL